jgi:3-methylfumaryl-CoA hydratase
MGDWDAWIGRTQEQSDVLTPGLLQRFRATIDSDTTGDIAPQGIHWCLCLPDAATAELGEDGHPKRGGFMPPISLPRRLWAASDITFHAPLRSGVEIVRRSTIVEISEKQGNSGPLVFVTIDHETIADGALAVSERQSVVYREATTTTAPTIRGDDTADLSNWPIHRHIIPSEPLLFRYSALTFNSHRIHYDHPYATGAEGYPGLVVHGPLIATLLLDLAAREFGANMLKRFSMRAQAPTFAGELLHLVSKRDDGIVSLMAFGNNGQTIISAKAEMRCS